MQVILPEDSKMSWQEQLKNVAEQPFLIPFTSDIMDFVSEVSKRLMQHPESRKYKDALALGHWLRKKHILELKAQYEQRRREAIWGPRGLVLHFAPSNVDTIFIYSWFLSMLLGNSNVVRISKQRSEQTEWLLNQVKAVLEQQRFYDIQKRVLIVSYGHDEELTRYLSAYCQMRLIWGGDETVRRIRAIPLPADALELAFADKFSLAAFEAKKVCDVSNESFNKFVEAFYNDAFWFNQKACSSPRAIIWIGQVKEIAAAKQRFWPALKELLAQKKYTLPVSAAMDRLVTAFDYAITGSTQGIQVNLELPTVVAARELTQQMREWHSGGGLFIELEREDLSHITNLLSRKDQTLTVYGFSNARIEEVSSLWSAKGLCRVVPVGQALAFDVVWDGYDLLKMFSREIAVGRF